MSERAQILIRRGVDLKVFREEIMPAGEPVILRGLVTMGARCAQPIRQFLARRFSRSWKPQPPLDRRQSRPSAFRSWGIHESFVCRSRVHAAIRPDTGCNYR